MSSFKISFLTLLRSTAMTLLFIPGVSAMVDDSEDWEKWPSYPSEGSASTSSSSTSSLSPSLSLGFEQRDEPQKLYLFDDRRLIKGEVPNDGTCFLHTLDMLFPDRGISRDEFTIRLSAAFLRGTPSVPSEDLLNMLFPSSGTSGDEIARGEFATRLNTALLGEPSSVSPDELRQEFAAELYTQLYQLKIEGGALGFKGKEIDSLSQSFSDGDLDEQDMVKATIQSIADNDEIIKEMLVAYAQTGVYLSLPAEEKRIGSFGLACQLFDLNLDVYSPEGQTNHLRQLKNFPFGGESPYQAALFEPVLAHVSPLCLETDTEARKRFAENEIKMMLQKPETSSSTVSGFASPSDPLSFTKYHVEKKVGGHTLYSYLASRFNVEDTAQYDIHMPQAPVFHPYHMGYNDRNNSGVPTFSFAARLRAGELNPDLFPALSEARATLLGLGINPEDPERAEYFYVVQNNPWTVTPARLLRPQSWAFPNAPYLSEELCWLEAKINVAISSPNNTITLVGNSEGNIISHNGKEYREVISSGHLFPMLSGLKEDQTSFFVSTVVIPTAKRAAVTFHISLSDAHLMELQEAKIVSLPELQNWLGNLFQRMYGYGETSSSSSPYSNWTTGSVSAIPSSLAPASSNLIPESSSSASSSTPAVPLLELDARDFHMGKRNNYPTTGFSAFEGTHRWTEGKKATITLPLAEMEHRPSHVSFLNTGGFVTAGHPQNLTVKVNGNEVKSYVYTPSNNKQTIDIDLPKTGPATIEFETLDAISPLNLGISADKRELGILFREVQFR